MPKSKSLKNLKRKINPMPDYVEKELLRKGLMDAYNARPPYQKNDYIGWIVQGRLQETQKKRLDQMINELKKGDSYMNIKYRADS